ncbi:PASTA domain-containing protein [Echinicola jeungdonensis]|uniref:PASTA domain-containing protein n=1 Tax=Echinicola jeungdonensis TaxID=709343 RepID=A0ABV5J0E5_9BACT|nr:PASTA domain-containing protein [Echinicola jeungdonensis]MDN3671095.1 PASTA domain-containing protein [Echinicola jeungdonensis]
MSNFKTDIKRILTHILIILGLLFALLFLFFEIFLPSYTHHGETVTVPDLENFHYDELEEYLEERKLSYVITPDSGFVKEAPPLTVLKQNPRPGAKVKEDRKIYITLNAENAPLVKMPNLKNSPLKNAQEVLANYGLVRGEIIYVPDIGINVVLDQKYRGRSIKEGFEIAKGSKIDLVVGDGLGKQTLAIPNLIGMDESEAEFLIVGSGLRIGKISYVTTDSVPKGTIVKQLPPSGIEAKTGELVDVWISELEKESNL